MEKVRAWCGQPSDRGRLKISSDQVHPLRSYEWRCKMQKMGWFGAVREHSRSQAMPPFDRAHTTCYSTLIETMRLSLPFSRYIAVICRTSPILTHPTCIWRPRRGWTRSNFAEICRFEILESLCGVVCVILRLAILVELRIVADRQTDGHRPMASTADA